MKTLLFLSIALICFSVCCPADTLFLKNGEQLEGIIIDETETEFKFKEYVAGSGFIISNYKKSEIKKAEKASAEENKELMDNYKRLQEEEKEAAAQAPIYDPGQQEVQEFRQMEGILRERKRESQEIEEEMQRREAEMRRQEKRVRRETEMQEREEKRRLHTVNAEEKRRERELQAAEAEKLREMNKQNGLIGMHDWQALNKWGTPTYKQVVSSDTEIWVYTTTHRKYTLKFKDGLIVDVTDEEN